MHRYRQARGNRFEHRVMIERENPKRLIRINECPYSVIVRQMLMQVTVVIHLPIIKEAIHDLDKPRVKMVIFVR